MPLTRCEARAPDGRQCCRPTHNETVKHLVARNPLTREVGIRIAAAWGYGPTQAASATDGFLSRGRETVGRFVLAVATVANAMRDAAARGEN